MLSEQLEAEEERRILVRSGISASEANRQIQPKHKVAYQTIVQLGGREGPFGLSNLTDEKKLQIKKIMGEYMTRWERKYPHMKLINVAVHLDEVGNDGKTGTVHMHITYCPVADGFEKGQKIQNSMTRALKQMGFENSKTEDGRNSYAIAKWQNDMRKLLEDIIAKYGYERKGKEDAFGKALDGSKIFLKEQGYIKENSDNIKDTENKDALNSAMAQVNEENLGERELQNMAENPVVTEPVVIIDEFDIPEISEIIEMPKMVEILEKTDEEHQTFEQDSICEKENNKDKENNSEKEVNTADGSDDKISFYNGLKTAITDGLRSLERVDKFLRENCIAAETLGCDYTLELECLQEHFNTIVDLLEYYQKSHKELSKDVVKYFIRNFKSDAMCINLKDEKPLYTVTEEVLLGIINKTLE